MITRRLPQFPFNSEVGLLSEEEIGRLWPGYGADVLLEAWNGKGVGSIVADLSMYRPNTTARYRQPLGQGLAGLAGEKGWLCGAYSEGTASMGRAYR